MAQHQIQRELLPAWFQYPPEFLRVTSLHLVNLDPWRILDAEEAARATSLLRAQYVARETVAFAQKENCETFACWEKSAGSRVLTLHAFATPGWESGTEYDNFWDWFRDAVDDMISWE